jgi:tetratricopeptide (TPR) repeat protein
VHYVLEGSVRRLGDRLRITIQLVDARSGSQVLADHFDSDQQEIFAVQDEIVRTIVGTLFGRLEAADVELARRKPPASLAAYECVLRGKALPLGNLQNEAEKRRLYEKAVVLDPDYGLAYALLAHTYFLEWFRDISGSDVALDRALGLATRAVTLDESDFACATMGWMCLFQRSFDLSEQYLQRSRDPNPNNPELMVKASFLYASLGRSDEAIGCLRQARVIDPYFNPTWYWHHLGYAHFIARRYEEAIAAFSHSTTMPFWVQAYLAASYALTDRIDRARAFAGEVLRLSPDFSSARLVAKEPFKHPADAQHLLNGLRRAGLPE